MYLKVSTVRHALFFDLCSHPPMKKHSSSTYALHMSVLHLKSCFGGMRCWCKDPSLSSDAFHTDTFEHCRTLPWTFSVGWALKQCFDKRAHVIPNAVRQVCAELRLQGRIFHWINSLLLSDDLFKCTYTQLQAVKEMRIKRICNKLNKQEIKSEQQIFQDDISYFSFFNFIFYK